MQSEQRAAFVVFISQALDEIRMREEAGMSKDEATRQVLGSAERAFGLPATIDLIVNGKK